MAMAVTGIAYMNKFHKLQGRRLMETLDHLVEMLWPALLICLICYGLEQVIEPMVIGSRWYMGPVSVALYGFGAIAILAVMISTNRLGEQERRLLLKIPLLRRFIQ